MADLETAGAQALEKLKELLPRFEEAAKTFDQAESKMTAARHELQTDWATVEQAAATFLEQVSKDRGELSSQTQETIEGIDGLKEKAADVGAKARAAADEARAELEDFAEDVGKLEPEIEAVMKQVEDAARSLRERTEAVEAKLEEVTSEVSEFLEVDTVEHFRVLREAVDERAHLYGLLITDEVIPGMQAKAAEVAEKLEGFAQRLQQKMEETGNEAREKASEALEKMLADHGEVIDTLTELGQNLQNVLGALGDAVESASSTVAGTKTTTDAATDTASDGLTGALTTIKEALDFLSRFSFV